MQLNLRQIIFLKLWRARVRRWADRIGKEASEFTEDLTGAKDLKQVPVRFAFIVLHFSVFLGDELLE